MNSARLLRRVGVFLGALVVLVTSVVLVHSSVATNAQRAPLAPTSNLSMAPTTMPGSSITSLPPSHDNDAGRSRIPDITPDADFDVSQLPR